jgi:flagellar biosynthetic protein FliR
VDWANLTSADVQHFLLAFFRITGIVMVAPVFGSDQVPPQVRVWLSAILAGLFWPLVDRTGAVVASNLGLFLEAVVLELGAGLMIGMAARMLFVAVMFGGQLIGQELGLTMANVIDPITQEQVSVLSQMKLVLGTLVYLAIDGHHFLIRATAESFRAIPLMGMTLSGDAARLSVITLMQEALETGARIAAPAMAALLLTSVVLAIMARAVPEMNIFVIGFALRLIFGLAIVALAIPVFQYVFEQAYAEHERGVISVLRALRP